MSKDIPTEKTATQMKEEQQARMDVAFIRTYCQCGWEFEGTAKEGRERALAHRQKKHPEIVVTARRRKRSPNPARISSYMTDVDRKEIEEERQRRARLLGIDLSEI